MFSIWDRNFIRYSIFHKDVVNVNIRKNSREIFVDYLDTVTKQN